MTSCIATGILTEIEGGLISDLFDPRSELAIAVNSKGYHDDVFTDGPYQVE